MNDLFDDYAGSHAHPVNVRLHRVAIPLIVFHIVAMLDWLPLFPIPRTSAHVTVAHVAYVAAMCWYLSLDIPLGLTMAGFVGLCFPIGRMTPRLVVVGVAVFAWALQLAGHVVWEKRQPAFLHNLQHALVGPIYFLAHIFRRMPRHPPPAAEGTPTLRSVDRP